MRKGAKTMTTQADSLSAALSTLRAAGASMAATNAAATFPVTGMAPAGAEEVSAITAAQFALHGANYQAMSAQANAMHELFLGILSAGAQAASDR